MTSEVVAMNRMGIAMAADSVLSVYSNGVHKKKHESGAKLFMLSNVCPIGIMIFNNIALLGVPWETVIKQYRQFLGHTSFDTLEEYGHHFISFLADQEKMFPVEVQRQYFLRKFKSECQIIKERVEHLVDQLPPDERLNEDTLSNAQIDKLTHVIEQRLDEWNIQEDSEVITEEGAISFLETISSSITHIVSQVFTEYEVPGEQDIQLNEVAKYLIYKLDWNSGIYTGLVIGGFGDQEHFPVMQRINVDGVYSDVLKWKEISVQRISEGQPSYIGPFAVTKAVDGFLTGIDPELLKLIVTTTRLIQSVPARVLSLVTDGNENLNTEWVERLISLSDVLATNLREQVQFSVQSRKKDVLAVVEMLPLKELANVASTLVKLSSFEQQLSPQTEVVGEPIDVAVISKGDGFIWIDRKYYFKKELNYRYFDNINRGILLSKEDNERG